MENMALLSEYKPSLYKLLEPVTTADLPCEVIQTKTGDYTAKVGPVITQEGILPPLLLHSKYDPVKAESISVEAHVDFSKDRLVVYGFGFGYHIEIILSKMTEKQELVILETNLGLMKLAFEYRNLSTVIRDSRVRVIVLEKNSTENLLETKRLIENSPLFVHGPSLELMNEDFLRLKKTIKDQQMIRDAVEKFKSELMENQERNSQLDHSPVSNLFGKANGCPLIIVSSGPSLLADLPTLREVQNRAVIITAGSAFRTLIQAGIRPDLVCLVDPQKITEKQFEGLWHEEVPMVAMLTASHHTITQYNGMKYFAKHVKEDPEGLSGGGSVATVILDLAYKMEAEPIIFIGQDLSFTGGKHHVEGSMYGEAEGIYKTSNMKTVLDLKGQPVETSASLLSFKNWIENFIEDHPRQTFINATSSGAFINGCQHMSLEEVFGKEVLSKPFRKKILFS